MGRVQLRTPWFFVKLGSHLVSKSGGEWKNIYGPYISLDDVMTVRYEGS